MAIHTQMLQRAGTVRRVVRHGAVYICGLCRRTYSIEAEAHDCLQSCWSDLLHLDPVLMRKSGLKVQYRCRFCARDHDEHRKAQSCAQACQQRMIEAFAAEDELYIAGEGPDQRPRRVAASKKPVLRQMVVAPRPKPAVKEVPKAVEAPKDVVAPVAAAPVVAPAEVAAAAPAPAAEADGGKKYKDADVFQRDGARYICKVCKKKHFTREDVVACFESHANEAPPAGEAAPS